VIEALRYRLHSAELLLVLDNCEHLLGACSALAEALLGSSPGLRVLATSREPLGVPGEAVFAVPPLADPRHQALEAAVAWSYELLTAGERQGLRTLSVFAGGFDLTAVAAVCCDGNESAALDLVDLLAGKSLVVCEPAAGGSRYRLLETIRQYAAGRLAEAGEAERTRWRPAEGFLSLAERERRLGVLLREHDNFRAALDYALAAGDRAGPRLARALGGFWLAQGLFEEGQGWLERALATDPADQRLRADLLRALGAVLYLAGDIERALSAEGQALEAAEVAGAACAHARIRVLQAEIHATQDGMWTGALQACEAAIPQLEAGDDLEGLADAWLLVSKLRFWSGEDPVRTGQALTRRGRRL
jgi:tetratricopeptide (TPR) repeat protein